jgi:hypothetical protein
VVPSVAAVVPSVAAVVPSVAAVVPSVAAVVPSVLFASSDSDDDYPLDETDELEIIREIRELITPLEANEGTLYEVFRWYCDTAQPKESQKLKPELEQKLVPKTEPIVSQSERLREQLVLALSPPRAAAPLAEPLVSTVRLLNCVLMEMLQDFDVVPSFLSMDEATACVHDTSRRILSSETPGTALMRSLKRQQRKFRQKKARGDQPPSTYDQQVSVLADGDVGEQGEQLSLCYHHFVHTLLRMAVEAMFKPPFDEQYPTLQLATSVMLRVWGLGDPLCFRLRKLRRRMANPRGRTSHKHR